MACPSTALPWFSSRADLGVRSAFQLTCSKLLDTTYFLAALIVRAKASIQSGLALSLADRR